MKGSSEIQQKSDEVIRTEVTEELKKAKEFLSSLDVKKIKDGSWYVSILKHIMKTYDKKVRAEYFQNKYMGLPPDEIADTLISVTARYAAVAGVITGSLTSSSQIAAIPSSGLSLGVVTGAIGMEMVYLSVMQLRLVLDLCVIYKVPVNMEDPEDILRVIGYALGVSPTGLVGHGLQKVSKTLTERAIKKYISKATLDAIKNFGQIIGVKILQRSIIKYALPGVSMATASSYNYATTKATGRITKAHIKSKGKMTSELRKIISREQSYDIAFPAAVLYLAQVDGEFADAEKELYRTLISNLCLESHDNEEFQTIISSEENILEAIQGISDREVQESLIDALILMAAYDGNLAPEEREFLTKLAKRLDIPLDIKRAERLADEYRKAIKASLADKTVECAKELTSKTANLTGQAAKNFKNIASTAGSKMTGTLTQIFSLKKGQNFEKTDDERATQKECRKCKGFMPIDFAFCPSCGTAQSD